MRDARAMGANDPAVGKALTEAVGPARVLTGERIPPRYRMDALRPSRASPLSDRGEAPAAVGLPIPPQEVSAGLRLPGRVLRPAVAWGAGSGRMGRARPRSDAIS